MIMMMIIIIIIRRRRRRRRRSCIDGVWYCSFIVTDSTTGYETK